MYEVVGLDLSLTSTGIAWCNETTTLPSKLMGMARLADIRDRVVALLRTLDNPLVIVEGYSFGSKNSQSHATGELGGVVRLRLFEDDIPYVDVPPTTLKKFATGKGVASKPEVTSAISARTGIVWSGKGADDRCDAWALQEFGLLKLGRARYSWPKVNAEALDKVVWPDLH